jgi:hypothetical protein
MLEVRVDILVTTTKQLSGETEDESEIYETQQKFYSIASQTIQAHSKLAHQVDSKTSKMLAIHLMRNVTKILIHHASEAIKSFNEKRFRLMYDLFSVLLGKQFVKTNRC